MSSGFLLGFVAFGVGAVAGLVVLAFALLTIRGKT